MTYADALRSHVERSLERDLGMPGMGPDDDGDYGAVVDDLVVWIRPLFDEPVALVRVWTPAVHDVKRSAALLKEVNELNLGLRQTRCIVQDGSLVVAAEVEIESIADGLLGRLVTQVGESARHVGVLIATVYGGELPLVSTCACDAQAVDESD